MKPESWAREEEIHVWVQAGKMLYLWRLNMSYLTEIDGNFGCSENVKMLRYLKHNNYVSDDENREQEFFIYQPRAIVEQKF